MQRTKSKVIYENLCTVMPRGVNSPVRCFAKVGIEPMVVASGNGDTLIDEDGNQYIDFCNSWGALILGHAHPEVLKKMSAQMQKGTTFGITTQIEGFLAQKIKSHMPHLEKIRFVSSGTEATMSAIRLARGYTSKNIVIKFSGHYHGHSDSLLVEGGSGLFKGNQTTSSAGIPSDITKNTLSLPFNDLKILERCFNSSRFKGKIAAVIVEPVAGNMGVVPASLEFMELLHKKCKEEKALLIYDEVITGFRVGLKGSQTYFGIVPDLTCLGKIIGGGLPCAAFGGRSEIMDYLAPNGPVYQAGTLSGNPLAMQAGVATLEEIEKPNFYESLQLKTDLFCKPIEELISKKKLKATLQRVGSMFTLFIGGKGPIRNAKEASNVDTAQYAHFFSYLFERGIYIPPAQHEAWFITQAHSEDNLVKASKLICHYMNEYLS